MWGTVLLIVVVIAVALSVRMYYRELENSRDSDHDFRNDGQSHLIF